MRVFLHTRSNGVYEPINTTWDTNHLPSKGDYIATSSDANWFEVVAVVFCNFADTGYDAEVYAVEIDSQKYIQDNFVDKSGIKPEPGFKRLK